MDSNTLFDGTIGLAERALDLRSRRHELLLSNIANADTPGYKAFDLMVEEAMARQRPAEGQVAMVNTHPGHLPTARGGMTTAAQPQELHLSTQVTLRGDGNTVNMEREMASLAENQLHYRAVSQILSSKFQRLRSVIKGGQ
ncbi:flagellar basal body rod protein FlgB [Desulfatitalea alkaliphila]|uniref:Flagellar basal body rod protein FlgB n=1 Tax=Desulfatitalea alkaliphila TaxID=2929485 RepID=A0AA41UJM4_9BACT|nr:flagellar basal body rod protein FlgB [Desulfatitalea alkaliphila]MCJ8501314.1 flagellar basal body rod protein FlgB [Desulfatitalea alkaliphila]